jgi:hypothetical protein
MHKLCIKFNHGDHVGNVLLNCIIQRQINDRFETMGQKPTDTGQIDDVLIDLEQLKICRKFILQLPYHIL